MKIPFTNIEIGRTENKSTKVRKTRAKEIVKAIQESQLTRTREDVDKWRNALSRAESVLNPDRTDLNRIYKDIMLDSHLTSLVQTIVLKTTSSPFLIEDSSGEISEEYSDLFKKKWFRDFMRYVVESPIYGYSLIQIGDIINKEIKYTDSAPREYVIPEKRAFKKHLHISNHDLVYFDDRPYDLWTIFVHEKKDLGLLNKAAPLIIWKKNVLGAWSEAAELFGMPMRTGKTDINNPVAYKNMTSMLESMGSAAWAVMDAEDEIEFKEITKSDYYQVYDKLIERVNSELSKLILGQTMSSDDGSSRSQAEVHERVMDDYVSASRMLVADVVNEQLLPLMVRHGIIPNGLIFRQDNEEKIDIKSRFDMVDKISKWPNAEVPLDYIEETFGVPLEEKEPPPPPEKEKEEEEEDELTPEEKKEGVMPSVSNWYKEIQSHKH